MQKQTVSTLYILYMLGSWPWTLDTALRKLRQSQLTFKPVTQIPEPIFLAAMPQWSKDVAGCHGGTHLHQSHSAWNS